MKTRIILLFTGVLLLISCNGVSLSNNSRNYNTSDKDYSFIQEYKVTSPANVRIGTSGGNIIAEGRESDVIEVAFVVKKRNQVLEVNLEGLKELAEVEINHDNSTLEIIIRRTFERNISVGFIIKTPVRTSCKFNTSGGNVSAANLTGTQDLHTSGGNIDLDRITGTADAGTSGGNISISKSEADFNASTSGGNISMNDIKGKLRVSTSGGNIDASNITEGLYARTSGGNIQVSDTKGPVDVNTSGGSIDLEKLSGSVRAVTSGGGISADISQLTERLELKTSGGDIHATIPAGLGLDLDLSGERINMQLSNFSGISKKDRIKGQMNGGGILVLMTTSGGTISLDYR